MWTLDSVRRRYATQSVSAINKAVIYRNSPLKIPQRYKSDETEKRLGKF